MRLAFAAAVLLAAGWAFSNTGWVPPGSQAVLLRFGRVVGVRHAGLSFALPRPFGNIVLLPDAERQQVLEVAAARASERASDAAPYLTGDGGIVLLDAAIYWRIADASAYGVARDDVPAALRRIFLGAAVAIAAARPLDDFLAPQAAGRTVRGEIVMAMNAQLASLTRGGAGLGVEVTGADVKTSLPPSAASRSDAVSDATQRAGQVLAEARADATRTRQQAEQSKDLMLGAAQASAAERLAGARANTALVSALEARMDPAGRPSMLDQIYRDRIGRILRQAGRVSAVDAKSVSRLILPGAD